MSPVLPPICGLWRTKDDETGEEKSYIRISERETDGVQKYFATIEKLLLLPEDTLGAVGRYSGKKLVGADIILDLTTYEDYWSYGTIIDPKSGGEYKCSCWFENKDTDTLFVRGTHWTGAFRTQNWTRLAQE